MSSSARIFSWSVAPIAGSSVARPLRASAATDTDASRTRLCGRPVGEHAMHDRAVELVQVAQLFQGVGDRAVGQLGLGHVDQGRAGERAASDSSRRGGSTL